MSVFAGKGWQQPCSNCNQPMEGFQYEWVLECGNSDYEGYRFHLPLRCPDCGVKDWKHEHVQRYRVTYCKNEDCNDQEVLEQKDTITPLDYSRIEFPVKSVDGARNARAMEIIFGTSERKKLVKLGRKMNMKEIDSKMEEARELGNKYTWSELYEIHKGDRKL